jgi:hypothetical protein
MVVRVGRLWIFSPNNSKYHFTYTSSYIRITDSIDLFNPLLWIAMPGILPTSWKMKEIEERLKQNAILPHGVLLCVLVARKNSKL